MSNTRHRKRKITNSVNAEITADDVKKLWEKTKPRGSQPTDATNELFAEVMNANRVKQVVAPSGRATLNAIRTLLRDDGDDICLLGGSADKFRRLLDDLEAQVSSYHEASKRSWQPAAVLIIWSVVQHILKDELTEFAGISRSSVAVKLTAATLKRMGWNGVDAPGIEALLKKLPKGGIEDAYHTKQSKTNL